MNLLLALPLGLVVGLALGALGGGGSILAVPALVYVVGLGPKEAVTTSLVVVGVAALGGMIGHWRAGRVRVIAGLWFSLAGVAGSLLGSRLNRAVNPDVLLAAFAGVMVIAAWRMWMTARTQNRIAPALSGSTNSPSVPIATTSLPTSVSTPSVHLHATPVDDHSAATPAVPAEHKGRPRLSTVVKVVAAGTVVGFMTGFFGVGGGFIIVPALVLALGFDMPTAIGTSLLVIAVNCAVALASRLATTGVDWHVALPFTVAALAGAVAGNHLASRTRASTLLRWFAVLLVAVAAYTLARSLASL
ncbi:MAG TPA: sulfite exporter TauE/SafE family protein [Acidimicrobiales bacterium]|nr:sulfite exporter TauE/SafE family protein [Acidimicrobiales bacterium]